MKRLMFFITFLVFLTTSCIAQTPKDQQFLDYINHSFQKWDMPGVAVALVRNNQIVFAKGFGYVDWAHSRQVDEKTIYPIGSISKSFTALALAQLVEQKKIKWNDRVKDYIPQLQLYDRYVTDHLTIEDLLCHRVGYETFSGDLLWYRTIYSPEQIVPKIKYLKPTFDFRDGFGYSNLMFMLAGIVIERVTGMPWEQYVKQNIFDPLEMTRTNTEVKLQKSDPNFAPGCMTTYDGKHIIIEYIPSHNIGAFGGINSSVIDLAKYMIMLMNGGEFNNKHIVSEKQIQQLWQVHNPLPVTAKQKQLYPTRNFYGYGLGWFVYDQNGYKIVTHSGGMDGALSKLVMIPELKTGFIILTNSDNFLYSAMAEYFVDLYTGIENIRDWNEYYIKRFQNYKQSYLYMKNRHKKIPNTKPDLPLEKYAGTYHDQMYGDIQITLKNGELFMHFVPTPYLDAKLLHWHYNTFEIHFINPLMAIPTQWGLANFVLDEDGNITKLILTVPNYDFLFYELEFYKKE